LTIALAQLDGELHVLTTQVRVHVAEPGDVVAWACEALDKPNSDGVADVDE
jgi:hypothetical protein